jgi:hypothetical protein
MTAAKSVITTVKGMPTKVILAIWSPFGPNRNAIQKTSTNRTIKGDYQECTNTSVYCLFLITQ